MKRFACAHCSNEIYFDNDVCVSCQSHLGYLPSRDVMLPEPGESGLWAFDGKSYSRCSNFQAIGCNWLVDSGHEAGLCRSCLHTRTIPDLSINGNALRWGRLEAAKRALFYSIDRFGLSVDPRLAAQEPDLWFEFLADEMTCTGQMQPVLTGHDRGLITLNIAESDDAEREKRRSQMGEPYRTLIGHFRHEIGHYYWDKLVDGSDFLNEFRQIFGDERQDYAQALEAHYQQGAPANWEITFVSAYASAHPWEDFAETFAHVFHIVDGVETAEAYGLVGQGPGQIVPPASRISAYQVTSIEALFAEWVPVTVAMNAMNRSIGQPDFYPFVLSEAISQKLQFILRLIHAQQNG